MSSWTIHLVEEAGPPLPPPRKERNVRWSKKRDKAFYKRLASGEEFNLECYLTKDGKRYRMVQDGSISL